MGYGFDCVKLSRRGEHGAGSDQQAACPTPGRAPEPMQATRILEPLSQLGQVAGKDTHITRPSCEHAHTHSSVQDSAAPSARGRFSIA